MTESGHRRRVAALGDIHIREDTAQSFRPLFERIAAEADILVLCGDLTNRGLAREAGMLVEALSHITIPVIGVLGNHDVECGEEAEVTRVLCQAGVVMLDDEPYEVMDVGFAGAKGFCGGFDRHELSPFGEAMIKKFVHESIDESLRLESGLAKLRTPHKFAVLHYAPVRDTVEGEPPEIFPFLGSSRLADPLDRFGITAALHGHAHNGTHRGQTARGVPVYNVAFPIMQRINSERPYLVLELD
ncbi:MAG: metallophosphoesterase [Chloroflexota bacterium]